MAAWNRRRFLLSAVTLGASASVLRPVLAQSLDADIQIVPLNDTMALVTGAGGNVVLMTTSEGVVMVDGGDAAHSDALLRAIGAYGSGGAIAAMFNTHWHHDHTGSNLTLGGAGIPIIAHENTRLWLGGDFYVDWQQRRYRPQPQAALPTETFRVSGERTFGDQPVHYGYLPLAHTDGDIYVRFPQANVIVAGDAVAIGAYPLPDYSTGGWLGGMIESLDLLLSLADGETRIIAGKGPPVSRRTLEAQRAMLSAVMERMVEMMGRGMSAGEMLGANVTEGFDERWGDPRQFVAHAYQGLWAHVYALEPKPI